MNIADEVDTMEEQLVYYYEQDGEKAGSDESC